MCRRAPVSSLSAHAHHNKLSRSSSFSEPTGNDSVAYPMCSRIYFLRKEDVLRHAHDPVRFHSNPVPKFPNSPPKSPKDLFHIFRPFFLLFLFTRSADPWAGGIPLPHPRHSVVVRSLPHDGIRVPGPTGECSRAAPCSLPHSMRKPEVGPGDAQGGHPVDWGHPWPKGVFLCSEWGRLETS